MLRRLSVPTVATIIVVLAHLPFLGAYGFFRDELYFIACGAHPAAGYIDQPPLIPLLTRLAYFVGGGNLALFRAWPLAAHAATVLVTSRLARKLGAGAFGQALAALCVAVSPGLAAGAHLFTTNTLEPLLWVAIASVYVHIRQSGDERWWLLIGALVGVGVESKHSMLFFVFAMLVALGATRERSVLVSKWFFAALGLATLLAMPHVVWQLVNHVPMLELLQNGRAHKNADFVLGGFLAEQAQIAGLGGLLVCFCGIVAALRAPERWPRPLALAHIAFFALMVALEGKGYYVTPIYPLTMALGAAVLDSARARIKVVMTVVTAATVVILPMVMPVLPPEHLPDYLAALHLTPPRFEKKTYGALPQWFADQFGWREMVASIVAAMAMVPEASPCADCPADANQLAVLVGNYGEAAALELFSDLHPVSGHNAYWTRGPGHARDDVVLTLDVDEADLTRVCSSWELLGRTPDDPRTMPYERDLPIHMCRGLRPGLRQLWPKLKHFE